MSPLHDGFRAAAILGQLQRRAHGRAPLPTSMTGIPLVAANSASDRRAENLSGAPLDHVPTQRVPEHKYPALPCWLLLSALSWALVAGLWQLAKALIVWGAA